ncbi:putative membrane protein YccC [Motilibacter peucedani]|uniref:Putative membrane protein YccC n=1 Tax=Motilibacter peucedani TaxID=598650 RepID=A0A420XJW3_9ACTN|nr:FUSC family protein [Motilibacter peucedani]RKS67979.1 putative membrane protein YccC [Motilibacter peucedani]
MATGTVRSLVRQLAAVDRSLLLPGAAVRAAVGVAVVLVVGVAAGSPASAVAAAAGAFSVGIASIQGAYRSRVQATVATSIAMALSTLVGAFVVRWEPLAVGTVAVWAFAAGMATAFGPPGTVVGLQAAVALLIAGDFAMTAREAVTRSLLVLAGGLLQTALVVAVWPLRSYAAERRAVAAVYRALADYAGQAVGAPGDVPPPRADELSAAAAVLGDPNPFGRDGPRAGFRALVDIAGRVRLELSALTHARARALGRRRDDDVRSIDAALGQLAVDLGGVADELLPWFPHEAQPAGAEASATDGLRPSVVASIEALRGQLRSAARVASGLASRNGPDAPRAGSSQLFEISEPHLLPPLAEPMLALRASWDLRSETMRHALRLAAVVLVASLLFHTFPLPHGYWVALTALVVLRPDFASTMSRGVARVIGTALGALVATVVAAELRPAAGALVVLVSLCAFVGYLIFRANQAIFSTFLTGYVVFLLALVGLPGRQAALDRLVDTAIGGTLALVAYAAWPTWEAGRVRERLAELVTTQVAYASDVLEAYASATARTGAGLARTQADTRRARASAEASVQRFAVEPRARRAAEGDLLDIALAEGVIAAAQRDAQALLSLHARLPGQDAEELPQVAPFVAELRRAGAVLDDALRGRPRRHAYPALRAAQLRLAAELGDATVHRRLVALETDIVVDALDTMAHLAGVIR